MSKLPGLTVVRTLVAAMNAYQENMIGTHPSKKEIREFNMAVRWLKDQCVRVGISARLSEEDLDFPEDKEDALDHPE